MGRRSLMGPMGLMGLMGRIGLMGRMGLGLLLLWLLPMGAVAQGDTPEIKGIKIGGNVYGGGNKGNVNGNTRVTVREGNLNNVFGGARMADVGGNAFVNIDGEHAIDDVTITSVYGGNDIAGTIGTTPANKVLPTELEQVIPEPSEEELSSSGKTREEWRARYKAGDPENLTDYPAHPKSNDVDKTWDAFVRTSRSTKQDDSKTVEDKWILVGTLFGGGNGEYEYVPVSSTDETKTYDVYLKPKKEGDDPIATITVDKDKTCLPELAKTYLEIKAGEIAHLYGGGNNATVTENTTIYLDNESDDCEEYVKAQVAKLSKADNSITPAEYAAQVINGLKNMAKLSTFQSDITSFDFNHARVFGGNNVADMRICPTWNLHKGAIRDLYSGGNQGSMTNPQGILLEIPAISQISALNVYGGCRMADVRPMTWSTTENKYVDVDEVDNLEGYYFPRNLAARLLVRGGTVKNVYGGNDIRGRVYFGTAVGVYTSISGDIYGGGNGSYAYTDNSACENDDTYGDFYYAPGENSLAALNAIRPNTEQVSIRVTGKYDKNETTGENIVPTVVGGSIYCGGNSATLMTDEAHEKLDNYPLVELKIGSYVRAENVFLGNNGENLVTSNPAEKDQGGNITKREGTLVTMKSNVIINNQNKGLFSTINLTDAEKMSAYMDAAAMSSVPSVVYDNEKRGDPATYIPYTTYIGSFFCGGNVGSMTYAGLNQQDFSAPIYIYNKVVGGCNNANVPVQYPTILDENDDPVLDESGNPTYDTEHPLNAAYEGGILGFKGTIDNVAVDERTVEDDGYTNYYDLVSGEKKIKDRLELVFNGTRIEPKRLNEARTDLVWNTNDAEDPEDLRLLGGNVYGGCYNSGHVNGNVAITIKSDLIDRSKVFGEGNSGVDIESQAEDVMTVAMTVFGAGYGADSEIWGGTTVNLTNSAYAFQLFGGGEKGVVGKKNGSGEYVYNPQYSTVLNLNGTAAGTENGQTAETEYIYGGGNEGLVCGDTHVNLGNGRLEDAFGGATNADILGHTEVYVGGNGEKQTVTVDNKEYSVFKAYGFPWLKGNAYGGNDLGGRIRGKGDFTSLLTAERMAMVYDGDKSSDEAKTAFREDLLKPSTFVTYVQGHVDRIMGGNYGSYDYTDDAYNPYIYTQKDKTENKIPAGKEIGDAKPGYHLPHIDNSFVYFQPANKETNEVSAIFGGCEGFQGDVTDNNNTMQLRSYVLIDDILTTNSERYKLTDIFGGGAFAGLGGHTMTITSGSESEEITLRGSGRSAIDLFTGTFNNVYAGCNQEGLLGYGRVNVPSGSTIHVNALYGGGKGYEIEDIEDTNNKDANPAAYCDNFVSCVNFKSGDATVENGIYGGNRNIRVAFDTYLNICAPVKDSQGKVGKIYGAGYGKKTVTGRTNVYLNNNAEVQRVYGGGRDGNVFNYPTLTQWLGRQYLAAGTAAGELTGKVLAYGQMIRLVSDFFDTEGNAINLPSEIGTYNNNTLPEEISSTTPPDYYNTNVHLLTGSKVVGFLNSDGSTDGGYAYGGGLGSDAVVAGTTYIELKGGYMERDLYGAGEGGPVFDEYKLKTFTVSSNVNIEGGTVRNVFGGGYLGHVGSHTKTVSGNEVDAAISDPYTNDIYGDTYVTIGKLKADTTMTNSNTPDNIFANGVPAVRRNVYAGGEGGSVYGTAHLTINNGYIGYLYENTDGKTYKYFKDHYIKNLDQNEAGDNILKLNGNAFGGGYVASSYVDQSEVEMWGGTIRGSLYGGGEIGPIGRGTKKDITSYSTGLVNGDARIFKAGHTSVTMYNGLVERNVFGGGRGKDSWGGQGWNPIAEPDLSSKGNVFGKTKVFIRGGEIGTTEGMADSETANEIGNVFGGSDEGFVYSAYEDATGNLFIGKQSGLRYDDNEEGYYYRNNGTNFVDEDGKTLGSGDEKRMTEDCRVLIEPWLEVTDGTEYYKILRDITTTPTYTKGQYLTAAPAGLEEGTDYKKVKALKFSNDYFEVGDYVPTSYLNTLPKKQTGNDPWAAWAGMDAGTSETVVGDDGKEKIIFNERGVIIHNAVFAGGNIASGSSMHANTKTVYGNATASVNDVYHRDLITIGTGHTGGLYGDGNLTFVDGYRGLNITNYGTDYYAIDPEISLDTYEKLPPREQAYYELRYKCVKECTDRYGTVYKPEDTATGTKASTITTDELVLMFVDDNGNSITTKDGVAYLVKDASGKWVPNPALGANQCWVENGVCSRYAGRIMNTIQRADFCGVFGSRMVMQGAQDRVPEISDFTNYTINRVREVSLNKKLSVRTGSSYASPDTGDDLKHGNYFGIYSIVNFLGALTSDVDFGDGEAYNSEASHGDIRVTDNKDDEYKKAVTIDGITYGYGTAADKPATYYHWKKAHHKDRMRNNGKSHNQVALASGVYLELTTENSTGAAVDEKDWGLITGVVELDLINVQAGVGGGFVYAKNVHGKRVSTNKHYLILTDLNTGAVTNRSWRYDDVQNSANVQEDFETSGNFVHNTQTIIDDCYNISGKYKVGDSPVPAHYWFIKGSVYVYDQIISAYTGSPNAYSESVEIPLTITAASHGEMKLLNVQPNLYAYYSNKSGAQKEKLTGEQKLTINDVSYQLNDPISYWDWNLLQASEKELFVPKTYVTIDSCMIGNKLYPTGYVMLPSEYTSLMSSAQTKVIDGKSVKAVVKMEKDDEGNDVSVKDKDGNDVYIAFDYVFRSSNNLGHDEGYILTYDVNNPKIWDKWYTPIAGGDKLNVNSDTWNEKTKEQKDTYYNGPTYTPTTTGLFGQRTYEHADIIAKAVYTTYNAAWAQLSETDKAARQATYPQATFNRAYVVTKNYAGTTNYYEGAPLDETTGASLADEGYAAPALVCTKTIQITKSEFITEGELMTESKRLGHISDINTAIGTLLAGKMTEARITVIKDGGTLTDPEKAALGKEGVNSLSMLLEAKKELDTSDPNNTDCRVDEAYYCTSPSSSDTENYHGPYYYGGDYYVNGKNYRGLEAWSAMSKTDRDNFTFNYDALDLLIDKTYGGTVGQKYQYDSAAADYDGALANPAGYSLGQAVDYEASFDGKYTDERATEHTISELMYSYSYVDEHNETQSVNVTITPSTPPLQPEVYETIPNEQRHYAQFKVTDTYKISDSEYRVYIVNTSFENRYGPYAVGQALTYEEYSKMGDDQSKITPFTFTASGGTYYYCREAYTIGKNGDITYTGKGQITKDSATDSDVNLSNSVTAALANSECYYYDGETKQTVTIASAATRSSGGIVPVGFVISDGTYKNLTNMQLGFSIHGTAPKEYSTLYVSRNSDIYDLSTEKIITVIYQYDYEESNEAGTMITPVSERHVVNIHIKFKSGIPTVTDITAPDIVLPGTSVTLKNPTVTPGAYQVFGGGWELFESPSDAESHTNGMEYTPDVDALYWYQDGYYIAYYAKTYLGKTYSNHVPVSVANYHDLKKVMDDPHHLHVDYDRSQLKRDSKIYINDYTTDDPATSKNSLDLLKDFFDLSLVNKNSTAETDGYTVAGGKITAAPGENANSNLVNQALLNTNTKHIGNEDVMVGVKGCDNLQFYLRTDIDHSNADGTPAAWRPIGTDDQCFEGTLHGDGHTISNLSGSLFYNLCGDVYNLGVRGSFTGAGVVDKGSGYVENTWVSTTAATKEAQPVFGNPTRSGSDLIQVVNSYYQEDDADAYEADGTTPKTGSYTKLLTDNNVSTHGTPNRKTAQAFYNGEVAYDLNGFYLKKRYCDKQVTTGGLTYLYKTIEGTGVSEPLTGHYDSDATLSSSGYNGAKYVEDRYDDGDFRYAGGYIPSGNDERLYVESTTTNAKPHFYPVWPDDYIFFGQALNYNHIAGRTHQDVPTAVNKSDGRIVATTSGNRVYRAPAYFGSKTMGVAHFNTYAVFAPTKKDDANTLAYKGMTAIDFTGHDDAYGANGAEKAYVKGWDDNTTKKYFYQPLLDDDGLTDFKNKELTQNLLVYTGTSTVAATKTNTVVKDYLQEPEFAMINSDYKNVDVHDPTDIYGHWVTLADKVYEAQRDHLLVDKQDFNAPIAYDYGSSYRIWYQRMPDNYVEPVWSSDPTPVRTTKGWEGVSLPFTADLVTTDDKGEITHFYSGSEKSKNGTESLIGHEYWLRNFTGIMEEGDVAKANFTYPDAKTSDGTKNVTNTFLWDYYYEGVSHGQKDMHNDTYQTYYSGERNYTSYPLLAKATPYLIGFPGGTYYEFDLSGTFDASTTALNHPVKLEAQTITFASKQGEHIGVSDDELDGVSKEYDSKTYTFKPNYMNTTIKAGSKAWTAAADGSRYDKVPDSGDDVEVVAFRPYFMAPEGSTPAPAMTRNIVFNNIGSQLNDKDPEPQDKLLQSMEFYAKKHKIGVTSHMHNVADVSIYTASGICVATFDIQPEETIETPINHSGVYIIRAAGGHYTNKVTVK